MSGRARWEAYAPAGARRPEGGAVGWRGRPAGRGPVGGRAAGAAAARRARPATHVVGAASSTDGRPGDAAHARPATTVGEREGTR
ncbi:hypothetical protein RKD29_002000 [Streptomyces tendae]|uniref:hypothetical protein n=1 Tax=Streptomyces tendae TaxID=1932 RepID=UPI003834236E